jgi:SAM-dependent methyltransferase
MYEPKEKSINKQRYIPALGYESLTALYDPIVRITTREKTVKSALLQQTGTGPGQRVLDLACGTATLTIATKLLHPATEIIGVDGDARILERARVKSANAGVALQFDEALSHRLPYPSDHFDSVLSSLFFHHLDRGNKHKTMLEVMRVIKPGGELHIADWGKAENWLMRGLFLGIQALDGFSSTADNVAGRLPQMMRATGFVDVAETQCFSTVFGTLSLYKAKRPARLDS